MSIKFYECHRCEHMTAENNWQCPFKECIKFNRTYLLKDGQLIPVVLPRMENKAPLF